MRERVSQTSKTERNRRKKGVSSQSLRKLQDDVPPCSPKGHMYSRGWTKVVGDIMGMQHGRLSVPHAWIRSITGTLSANGGDGQTDRRRVVRHPHDNPLQAALSVRLLAQQNNSCTTRRHRIRQNTRRIYDHVTLYILWTITFWDSFLICQWICDLRCVGLGFGTIDTCMDMKLWIGFERVSYF